MSFRIFNVVAAVGLLAFAGAAEAATVQLANVSGSWTDGEKVDDAAPDGLNTSTISWGDPDTDAGPSYYDFDGPASLPSDPIAPGTDFVLGTFTHGNNPVWPPSLDWAELTVDVVFKIDGVDQDPVSFVFLFDHYETTNNLDPCPFGTQGVGVNVNGCADRVTVMTNEGASETFEVGGMTYVIDITGFLYNDELLDEFWTTEEQQNEAQLMARFRLVPPSPVPLPAAGWLFVAGLGGLVALRRRRG